MLRRGNYGKNRTLLQSAIRENSIMMAAKNEMRRAGWYELGELYKLENVNATQIRVRAGEYTGHKVFYNIDGRMCKEHTEMINGVTICKYRSIN